MSIGWRALVSGKPCNIGRAPENDVVLSDPSVSRRHAQLSERSPGVWILRDQGSSTGTWRGSEQIQECPLHPGDTLRIGLQRLRFWLNADQAFLQHLDGLEKALSFAWPLGEVLIGRTTEASIQIPHPLCPKIFATLRRIKNRWSLRCQQRLCWNQRISHTHSGAFPATVPLPFGCLDLEENQIRWTPAAPGLDLQVQNLAIVAGKRTLLKDISFSLAHGELLAIIGGSGQGKSTLLRALAGLESPASGRVLIEGHSPKSTSVAWLSQEAPLHPWLTVEENLRNVLRLALPSDHSKTEQEELLSQMLCRMGLDSVRHSIASLLSGGERRRVALAMALFPAPGILFLDEPFAGLDPHNTEQLASWFRQLSWSGQTLVVTTHDYAILPQVDKILILHEGFLTFSGTPEEASRFFNADKPEEILKRLHERGGDAWSQAYQRTHSGYLPEAPPPPLPLLLIRRRNGFSVIWTRFWKNLIRDRGRFLTVLLQPLIIGGLLALIFQPASSLWIAAFAINLCANWFGMADSIREVIQEKDLLQQEMRQGLSPLGWLSAKWSGASLLAWFQTIFCAVILLNRMNVDFSLAIWISLSGILVCAVAPAVSAGLAASYWARTSGQANALLPLLLIPQLMFSGILAPLDQMHPIGKTIAQALWSFWNQKSLQNALMQLSIPWWNYIIPLGSSLLISMIVIIGIWLAHRTNKTASPNISTTTTMSSASLAKGGWARFTRRFTKG
ncbi:MAG TPA: ATP-binding cassette domain-containing protein [Fibrobacteraceae bacterium]|nr:ATP-binding cassette domain-containing protein [Fibrobacteraceae bacterium]